MMTKFGIPNDQKVSSWNHFGSRHAGIVNFAFGDGSVKSIRPGGSFTRNPASADWYVYQALSGMKDGQVPTGSLGN
jgi:prepilin-type processing-associated H-X9-DG protein